MTEPTDPPRADRAQLKMKTKITVRKWEGDDTSGPPIEEVVVKEDGYDELLEQAEKERRNATD